jgi:hypothetical protein
LHIKHTQSRLPPLLMGLLLAAALLLLCVPLLHRWVEAVVNRFRTYTNWPIESLKMDELIQVRSDESRCHGFSGETTASSQLAPAVAWAPAFSLCSGAGQ